MLGASGLSEAVFANMTPLIFQSYTISRMLSCLLLFLTSLPSFRAFPNGAGACPRGQAAPLGFHPPSSSGENSIEQAGYELFINGGPVNPGNEPAVEAGESYELALSGSIPFRGYLFRGESADGSFSLFSNQGQVANACMQDTEVGITHDDNSLKNSVTVVFEPTQDGTFLLDLSVVTANNANDGSIYSYTAYSFPIQPAQSIAVPVSPPIFPPMSVGSAPVASPPLSNVPPPLDIASAGNCRPWPNTFRRTLGQGWRVVEG